MRLSSFNKEAMKYFKWFNEPSNWELDGEKLVIDADSQTDFWQRTSYGFRNDNGHFLHLSLMGDFSLIVGVKFLPVNQYDQAGVMVRISPSCWLKSSVEFEGSDPSKLGAVVTNSGYSDWSTQNVPADTKEFRARVDRKGPDYSVCFWQDGWIQLRLARLLEDDGKIPVMVGPYCCSPRGSGYRVVFDEIDLRSE
ncbi:MAG: Uncharacterized protein XD94_0528 [Mesotoga prima]|uniref:DUF1349 domain-containing protein n=2 Tax=Mesotoga TaxID=1184396 RepID=A0A117M2U4_9BACT|nr:MAG: Uncharacterized protein XD94_0528 [Mesotoga prima]